ncbi:helix-turn-helix domain-containing protein (plasmid) [Halomicrobium sp. HM KBTZ05]|uniref:helix-turn-helix domain-containing protein n=1 Tax=Halomicrobium sp. HM KBTZ05 TaxID=3242663 RepID=UPI003555D5EF
MSNIVEASVPAAQFALAETFTRRPDVEVRMVRLVAHGLDEAMPFLWADCDDVDRLRRVVGADESVHGVDVLTDADGECLLRIDWGPAVGLFAQILAEADASILDASGHDGRWQFQIFFPEHDRVSQTYEFCADHGIDIAVERIDRLSETSAYGHLGLTERQYETLVSAYELGYYDVPRGINQAELAANFDISHQALSERLRRAHGTVVTNALYHRVHRRDHAVSPRMRHGADT